MKWLPVILAVLSDLKEVIIKPFSPKKKSIIHRFVKHSFEFSTPCSFWNGVVFATQWSLFISTLSKISIPLRRRHDIPLQNMTTFLIRENSLCQHFEAASINLLGCDHVPFKFRPTSYWLSPLLSSLTSFYSSVRRTWRMLQSSYTSARLSYFT